MMAIHGSFLSDWLETHPGRAPAPRHGHPHLPRSAQQLESPDPSAPACAPNFLRHLSQAGATKGPSPNRAFAAHA